MDGQFVTSIVPPVEVTLVNKSLLVTVAVHPETMFTINAVYAVVIDGPATAEKVALIVCVAVTFVNVKEEIAP